MIICVNLWLFRYRTTSVPTPASVKISSNTNVKIFGPFTSIPHDYDASSVSEVYKFYNLSEEEKIIRKMTDMGTYKGE